jgi:long-chain acyl-CoA synthetase
MSEPSRRNLQSFIRTMTEHGDRAGFARAGEVRREELSCSRTLALGGAVASELRRLGVVPGDRVILLIEDGPLWVAAFTGCLAAGAVIVPLEAGSDAGFAAGVAGRSGARVVLTAGSQGRRALGPVDLPVVDLRTLGPGDRTLLNPIADPAPGDLAEIVFTSGTTAAPRGVIITHGNILTALEGIERGIDARRRLVRFFSPIGMVSLVPLSHLFGQALGVFIPLILGARVVFSPTRPPRALLKLAKREKAWVMVLVPRHLASIRTHAARMVRPTRGPLPRRWWLRAPRSLPLVREHGWRLRAFVVGGARLDPDLERWFKDLGYLVVQGYGLTETAPIISVSNPFDERAGYLGKPSRAQEVRLAPDGEILVRGGNVTPGYYGDDAATKAAFEDGWFHTGDLGVIEPDGTLRFTGRKKDVIVTGEGQNVYPDEVEEALRRQTGVAECVVFAVEGEKGEEVHAAIIAAEDRAGADVAAAVAAANETLAPHQRIRGWTIWDGLDFPRTATGKTLRRVVAETVRARDTDARLAAGTYGRVERDSVPAGVSPRVREDETLRPAGKGASASIDPSGAVASDEGALASLRKVAGPSARMDQRLGAELGLSSIDVAEIASEIEERYQVEIDPSKIHEDASLHDLIEDARSREDRDERWPMPRWARAAPARLARGFLQAFVAFPLMRIFVRLTVSGQDRLEASISPRPVRAPAIPSQGPGDITRQTRPPAEDERAAHGSRAAEPQVIVAANHMSHFDVPVLLASMPRRLRRRVAVAMQPEYFEPYLRGNAGLASRLHLGWQYRLMNLLLHTFPFPRSAAFRVALEYSGQLVDEGWSILVFPEGELSPDGDIHAFRPGVGVLARRLDLKVLPARIRGAFDVIPRGTKFPKTVRSPVSVAWGDLVSIEPGEEPAAFARRLEAAVRSL